MKESFLSLSPSNTENNQTVAAQKDVALQREGVIDPSPRLFYSEGFKDMVVDKGIRMILPRYHLYGTQEVEEFSEKKRKQVEKLIEQHGMSFLEENPIIVCAIPSGQQTILAIIDGHHRSRYSSKFGISNLPAIVLTPKELAVVENDYNKAKGKPYEEVDEEIVVKTLFHDIALAFGSFSRSLPTNKAPVPIPQAMSVEELYTLFTHIEFEAQDVRDAQEGFEGGGKLIFKNQKTLEGR